jgi:hypothetical protein
MPASRAGRRPATPVSAPACRRWGRRTAWRSSWRRRRR